MNAWHIATFSFVGALEVFWVMEDEVWDAAVWNGEDCQLVVLDCAGCDTKLNCQTRAMITPIPRMVASITAAITPVRSCLSKISS